MRIIVQGKRRGEASRISCPACQATLEVQPTDWKEGTYGSERVVECPCCGDAIVKPGTEYHGDF